MVIKKFIAAGWLIIICSLFSFLKWTSAQQYQPQNIRITISGSDQMETSIAINPSNNTILMAGWNDYSYSAEGKPPVSGYSFSSNGGITWTTPDTLWVPGYRYGIDPSVGFDSFGNAYFCYIGGTGTPPAGWVYVVKTTNLGESWTYHQVDDAPNQFYDKSYMNIDNTDGTSSYKGRIYVTWSALSPNTCPIKFAYSPDYNMNFTTLSEPIDEIIPYSNEVVVGSVPAIGPNGEVYVVWMYTSNKRQQGTSGEIRIRKSTDGGESFGNKITVAGNISAAFQYYFGKCRISSIPAIAIDQNTGRLYVAWTEYNGGDFRIYFSYSDNGQNWSTKQLATDKTTDKQFFPWLTVCPNGIIGLAYTHGFYQSSEKRVDVYLAESFDAGANFFSPNLRITDVSSNPDNAIKYSNDYHGIDSRIGSYGHVLWTDFRNGNADIYTATVDLLMPIACANQSHSLLATAFNNGRRLIRDGNNRYHLVFESGGEIFYRRSNVGGTSWEIPARLSTANDNNKYPSISGTSSKQLVLWQRYTGYSGGQYKYDIYLSKNTGSGWSTAKIDSLSNLGFYTPTDPLPVVTYKTRTGGYRLLVGAKTNAAIKYVTSDNDGSTWSSAANVPSTSSSNNNPSLSMGPTTPASTVYLAYDDNNNIYYNSYTSSWGSAQNVSSSSGLWYNRYPSVEVDGGGGKNFAWKGFSYPLELWVVAQRRNSEPVQIFTTGGDGGDRASITGHSSNKRSIVYTVDNANEVYRVYYNGSSWSELFVASNAQHPNLSAGTTTAKYLWNSGSSSPYEINMSSEQLPPGGLLKLASTQQLTDDLQQNNDNELVGHRSAVIADTLVSTLFWLEWGEIFTRNRQGGMLPVELRPYVDSSLVVNVADIFHYLETDTITLPAEVDSIYWNQNFYGKGLDKLIGTGARNIMVTIQLVDVTNNAVLSSLAEVTFLPTAAETRFRGTVVRDITSYRDKAVILRVAVAGISTNTNNFVPGLAQVLFRNSSGIFKPAPHSEPGLSDNLNPSNFTIEQNFPNPFNATTILRYQLPQASHVTLKIYNLLGQRVRTLVDDHQAAGYHTVQWDGKDDMGSAVVSGVYFYVIRAREFIDGRKMVVLR